MDKLARDSLDKIATIMSNILLATNPKLWNHETRRPLNTTAICLLLMFEDERWSVLAWGVQQGRMVWLAHAKAQTLGGEQPVTFTVVSFVLGSDATVARKNSPSILFCIPWLPGLRRAVLNPGLDLVAVPAATRRQCQGCKVGLSSGERA